MSKINKCIIILIFISMIYSLLITRNLLLSIGLIFLLKISFHINNYNNSLCFIYLIFLLFAYLLGYNYNLYNKISYYDTIIHSLFGIICSIFSLPILEYLKNYNPNNQLFNKIFTIIFTLACAALWEIIEFDIDNIFHSNMQKGLFDTMKDIICAFTFSIIFSYIYNKNYQLFNKIFITRRNK